MLIKIGTAYVDPLEISAIQPDRDVSLPDYERAQQICITLKEGPSFWIDASMDEAEAALIDAGVIEEPDFREPPELSQAETEDAEELSAAGFEYLARDGDGKLFAYHRRPTDNAGFWMPVNEHPRKLDAASFPCIDFGECWELSLLLSPSLEVIPCQKSERT